jgi:hypothetical protein
MSGTKKLLLGLGVGCGLVVLLCCGGGGASIYVVYRSMKPSDDPKEVVTLTKSITEITIPEGLQPVRSVNVTLSVLRSIFPSWVAYEDKKSGATLILAQGDLFRSHPEPEIRQMVDAMLRPFGVDVPNRVLNDTKIDTHPCTIRGVQVTFTIVEGTDTKTKAPRIRVTGMFPGKSAQTVLLLDADADKLDKPAVVKMIDSIH